MIDALKLCLVTHPYYYNIAHYQSYIENAIQGGVSCVQFRDKRGDKTAAKTRALNLQAVLKTHQIPFIVNDDVALAHAVDADGVHLGQSDIKVHLARQLLGPDKLIGLSIESLDQLYEANEQDGLDYVAASAVFPSTSKTNCKTIWGLDGLKKIVEQSTHPVIAIGGITIQNLPQVMSAGAYGVAVISAIHDHPNPYDAARALTEIIHEEKS